MANSISWYYQRTSDATCAKADAYIESRGIKVREAVDARKEKLGKREIAQILRKTARVIATKGKKVIDWDLKRDPPIEKELYEALLGPTGNLRAPSIRSGKTLAVGFSEEAWDKVFG